MLTVAKVTGRQATGYAEYLEGKTQAGALGDYYLKDGERVEAPGRWATGAQVVGADPARAVAGEQLRMLMEVRRPDTGQPLRRAGATGSAVAALDATFSAPKTVSAAWAIGSPDLRARIEYAHERAIDQALRHAVQQVAMIRERVSPRQVIHAPAADVIATSWRHTTARAVADQLPDPQLHSHVLLHGAVRGDGRVVAIDSRAWLVHRRELGAAYRTELASQLAQLGFEIQRATGRGGRYFEIAGVPSGLVDRWSSRHHQVRQAVTQRIADREQELAQVIASGGPDSEAAREQLEQLRAAGQLTAGEDRYLTYTTRTPKQPRTRSDLDRHWTQTAADHRFDRYHLARLRAPRPTRLEPPDAQVLAQALTEFDATFTDRDTRAVALESGCGLPIDAALEQVTTLRREGELIELPDGRLTTRAHLACEQETMDVARRLTSHPLVPIPPGLVQTQTTRLAADLARSGARLTVEQRAAVALACSERQLTIIEGQAGTGKSTVLVAVARAHHAAGQHIITTSTAALAAQRLAADLQHAGVPTRAYSTTALRHAIKTRRLTLTPQSTIIHDEAALASTQELHPLLLATEHAGARLILIGDPRQSHAIGAAGLWPHLEHVTKSHDAHVELTHNVRAQDPADRRDQHLFRTGHIDAAIRGYATRGHITIHIDHHHAEDAALDAAQADRTAGKHTLVTAQTSNEHLDQLNARAQAIRHQHGELGIESLPLPHRPYQLHPGDEIQIRHTIQHPTHGPLRNGTTATIHHINPTEQTATLQLADDQLATLDRDQINDADLRLAYVQHPFPAQGTTTDTTHLITTTHTTHNATYVAITRARHTTHIHASHHHLDLDHHDTPIDALADHLSRDEPDLPAINMPPAAEHDITINPTPAPSSPPTPDRRITPPWHALQDEQPSRRTPRTDREPEHNHQRGYLGRVLGPQPDPQHAAHATWQQAASAVHDYRDKYTVADHDPRLLGPEPAPAAFEQRLDRRTTATLVNTARTDLHAPDLELRDEHEHGLSRYPSLAYDSPEWEP